jgi:PAS fold.
MKLKYKIVILSVMVGVVFIFTELLSTYLITGPYADKLEGSLRFFFEPMTTDKQLFFYLVLLLICFIFGLMLARMIEKVLKANVTVKQTDNEKNLILDFIPEIIIYVNKNYRVKWASRALYIEMNLSKKEVVDRFIDDITLDLFAQEKVIEKFNELKSMKSMYIELKGKNGKHWQVYSNPVMDENGKDNGFVFLAIDITRSKHDEEMKRRSYEQLENNIEKFATVVDSIRNPLSSIILLAEMSIDKEIAEEIIHQSNEIEASIADLDEGWSKSENIQRFLKKHS